MKSNRILILRPDNIGDVVLFSGALPQIRRLYPNAHITLAVQAHIVNLVELCPYLDAVVPVEQLTFWGNVKHVYIPLKHKLKKVIHGLNRLWNNISKPFDIIIYPLKSPSLDHLEMIYCLNTKRSFGIAGCNVCAPITGYPFELRPVTLFTHYLDVSNMNPWNHEFLVTLDFLRFLGCCVTNINDIQPQFWLSDAELNCLADVKRRGRKIIGLFPGASSAERCWNLVNYSKLSYLIGGDPIYVIFGSVADQTLADQVALQLKEGAPDMDIINLAGRTSLRELVKEIMSCDVLIATETSGLHIAIAAGIPSIGIVGGGHYGRFAPWGNPEINIVLTKKMECFQCNWACSKDEAECIQGVSPDDVACFVHNLMP